MKYIGQARTIQELLLRVLCPEEMPSEEKKLKLLRVDNDRCYELIEKEVIRLNYQLRVALAGLRKLTKERDRLSQLEWRTS